MKVIIFDINEHIISVCKEKFKDTDVDCIVKPFSEIEANFVVTAGNSHGWMSGGIDLAVARHLPLIELNVQEEIKWGWNNFLPVGKIAVLPFRQIHPSEDPLTVQHLIYAPTMEEPGTLINPEDAYYIACKIFRFMLDTSEFPCKFENLPSYLRGIDKSNMSVAICGLGTATGGLTADEFAEMIYRAYIDVIGNK